MAVAKLNLSVENEHELILISKSLSSEIRIRILKTLENQSMSVSEIAKILDEPISSTALNVKILPKLFTQNWEKRVFADELTTISTFRLLARK